MNTTSKIRGASGKKAMYWPGAGGCMFTSPLQHRAGGQTTTIHYLWDGNSRATSPWISGRSSHTDATWPVMTITETGQRGCSYTTAWAGNVPKYLPADPFKAAYRCFQQIIGDLLFSIMHLEENWEHIFCTLKRKQHEPFAHILDCGKSSTFETKSSTLGPCEQWKSVIWKFLPWLAELKFKVEVFPKDQEVKPWLTLKAHVQVCMNHSISTKAK